MPQDLTVIVLAAGGGTRMKSKTMKVLHPIGGRSMIGHVLHAVRHARARPGSWPWSAHQREQVGPHIEELVPDVRLAVQETQDGHRSRRPGGVGGAAGGGAHAAPCSWPTATRRCCRARASQRVRRVPPRLGRGVSILTGPWWPTRSATAGSSATRPAGVEAIVEEKDATPEQADDRRDQQRDPRLRRRLPGRPRCPGSATTTPRASTT